MRYADIVLPLAQPLYTFAVAEGVTLCEGMAVVVPFGRSKIYTGIVWRLHDRRPDFKTVKTVSRVLNNHPSVRPETRQKVLAAVQALGFEPALAPRGAAGPGGLRARRPQSRRGHCRHH